MEVRPKTPVNSSVTVGNTSTSIVGVNTGRAYLLLVNDSDETIYLGIGAAAVMNQGPRLAANGGFIAFSGKHPLHLSVNGICASGSKNLTITEISG